jgi:hypothetical protein
MRESDLHKKTGAETPVCRQAGRRSGRGGCQSILDPKTVPKTSVFRY